MSYHGGYNRGGGGYRGGRGGPMMDSPMSVGNKLPPFDITLVEPMFPKVKELEDTGLSQALVKRNSDLAPTPAEQAAVLNLVTKVGAVIEKMVVAPELFTAAVVEECRQVGSFKKGTMTTKHCVADLVVVLRTLPTVEAVTALGNKIVEEIKSSDSKEVVGCVPRDFGCEIAGTQAVVKLLVATIPANLKKLEPDLHLDAALMHNHLSAIRHARWFEDNAGHSTVKVLVRLMKDVRTRFPGFRVLNQWALELLSHYATMNTPSRQALPLSQAFKRVFQLLAAGLFLPGSSGLLDPCEPTTRIQHTMTFEEQDLLCSTAQTLLRVMAHGGYKQILGLEGSATVATEMSVWEGVVVTPLEKAYDAQEMEPLELETDEPMESQEAAEPNGQQIEAAA